MRFLAKHWLILAGLALSGTAAADIQVQMYDVTAAGPGVSVGFVDIQESPSGLRFIPHLHGLTPPGPHGFHLHKIASCANQGMAAGGHFDPMNTNHHLGPINEHGHLGDLPVLMVAPDGTATTPVLAPRLHSLSQINHLSLMIHSGPDNYSDQPNPMGGGGSRMVCGVVTVS